MSQREALLSAVATIKEQAVVIEECEDAQDFDEALAQLQEALDSLKQIA